MSGIRHIARHRAIGSRLVIAFLQIPDAPDKTLTIPVDSLPPYLEQAVMSILQSPEGQQAENLGEVLGRRMMPDVQQTVLASLHAKGYLIPQSVYDIDLAPYPNQVHAMDKVLLAMGRLQPANNAPTAADQIAASYGIQQPQPQQLNETVAMESDHFFGNPPAKPEPYFDPTYVEDRGNQFSHNQRVETTAQTLGIARNLLVEADMLLSEANRKRQKAYEMAPQLAPTETYAPVQAAPAPAPAPTPVVQVAVEDAAPAPKARKPRVAAERSTKTAKRPVKKSAEG